MSIDPESWSLAGNLVSAQFSAAWKSFPLPGPVPMAMLRKPDDQSMLVLQGSVAEQTERLDAELASFAPTVWAVARVAYGESEDDESVLVVELHEGEASAELRLRFKPKLVLLGQEGMPDGEGLAAFRRGFMDGYGHELRTTTAGPLFDDDWAAGREMVKRAVGDNVRLAGTVLYLMEGEQAALIDLADPQAAVSIAVEGRRLVAVAVFAFVVAIGLAGAGWVCGGGIGVAIAALPALFMVLVAVMALRDHPVLVITKGDEVVRFDVRNGSMEDTRAFVAELPTASTDA